MAKSTKHKPNKKHSFIIVWLGSKYIYYQHCWKSNCILSFSGPYFPAFGFNTDIYSVKLRILSECRKIRTRKTPNTDTFYTVQQPNLFVINPFQTNVLSFHYPLKASGVIKMFSGVIEIEHYYYYYYYCYYYYYYYYSCCCCCCCCYYYYYYY